MAEKIRVNIPKKYDLVVGDTFQLYYRGIIEAPNPYVYAIVSICEKGRNFPRYFEYTPTEPGQHKLTIKVYDAQRNLLGEGEKVRDDHRHHAIDALTIALTTPALVKEIASMTPEMRKQMQKSSY